jgi:OOP family OmpA-OmpF porin
MKIFVSAVFVFGWVFSFSQSVLSTKDKKAIEMYTVADNFRVRGQYEQAVQLLQQALDRDKGFEEAYFRLGLTYKSMHLWDKSNDIFLKGLQVTRDPKRQKSFYFELGDNYLRQGNYQKALDFLNGYLDAEMLNKAKMDQAQLWKRNAEFGLRNKKNDMGFKPEPLNDSVNRFVMQYFPVLTADEQEIIFTRRLGTGQEDDEDLVVASRKSNGEWGAPVSISKNINSQFNEGTCTISADGRQLIFTSCIGRKGYGNCDLFESRRIGEEWTVPVNMGAQINSAGWESQPSLSADGRVIYFVSDRRGGLGNRDLYFSYQLDDGKWTKAENLGPSINTPYDEISPFIHANGKTLYFASTGRPGFGGYDIFKTEKENSQWSEPSNFGSPVNNHEDQFSLFITADGEHGYYSHEEGFQQNATKIYQISVPEELRPKFKSNVVKGVVRDRLTRKPLKSRVELYDIQKNELVSVVNSDSITGAYLMVLTQGSDYGLYVSAKDYLFKSLNFNYENEAVSRPVVIDMELDKVSTGATAVLNNIFFDTDKYDLKERSVTELDKVVRFLSDNPAVKVEIGGHTDNVGTAAYNLQLSQKRAQSVADYLIKKGLDAKRIKQIGYGSQKPIKPNDSDSNRQANRRIEFKIIN